LNRIVGQIKKTYKGEQIAYHQIVTTAALVLGFIFCLIVIAIGIKDNPQYFTRIQESSEAWIIGVVFQPIAFILGYLLAWIFRFKRAECRAISIETGMQNTTVAIAICSLAYSGCDRYHSLYVVWMVSLWMLINGLIVACVFRVIARYDPPREDGTSYMIEITSLDEVPVDLVDKKVKQTVTHSEAVGKKPEPDE